MKPERLAKALDDLVADGVLGADQRAAVEKRLAAALFQKADVAGRFVSLIAILGGVLVAAGVISFVAYNWDGIDKSAKLAGIGAWLAGIHVLGFLLADRYPRSATALTAVGVLSFGGALGLVAQIYDLHEDPARGWLAWWLLSVPFVFVTRSPRIFEIVLFLFGAWIYVSADRLLEAHEIHGERPWVSCMSLLTLSLGALLAALAAYFRGSAWSHLTPSCRRIAVLLVLAGPFVISFGFWGTRESSAWAIAPSAEVAGAALVLAAFTAWRARNRDAAAVPLAALLGWSVLAATVVFVHEAGFIVANVVLLGTITVLIRLGIRRGTSLEINLAILTFLVMVLSRYLEFMHHRMDATVGFLGAGVILLGLGFFLERRRRVWVQASRERIE